MYRLLQITVSLTNTTAKHKTVIDQCQSIYLHFPLTHSSIHPYDIQCHTLMLSIQIFPDHRGQRVRRWIVSTSSIRLHKCDYGWQLHTTCLCLVDQFNGSNTIESKNVVVCKIVTRWQSFHRLRGRTQFILVHLIQISEMHISFRQYGIVLVFSPPHVVKLCLYIEIVPSIWGIAIFSKSVKKCPCTHRVNIYLMSSRTAKH